MYANRCVQKASGTPQDMAGAARSMNDYLDMFPQVCVEYLFNRALYIHTEERRCAYVWAVLCM